MRLFFFSFETSFSLYIIVVPWASRVYGICTLSVVIGASLSEPHTSGTAFRKCVNVRACLRPYTVNFKWAHSNISRRSISWALDLLHEAGLLRATARVQRRQPGAKLKHAWQLLVCASTDHQRHAAHRRYKYGHWLRLLQVEQVTHGTRNPAHGFIVKLTPCTCSYLAALAGEIAGICGT